MTRALAVSSARIKLRHRHLTEWQELVRLQLTLLHSFRAECARKLSLHGGDKTGYFYLQSQQLGRIKAMMVRQRHGREQLKARQSGELLSFEQSL